VWSSPAVVITAILSDRDGVRRVGGNGVSVQLKSLEDGVGVGRQKAPT
jgi:hypothetical protein